MSNNKDLFSSSIDRVSIGRFSEDAYLNYSMYVILDRAPPESFRWSKTRSKKNYLCYE